MRTAQPSHAGPGLAAGLAVLLALAAGGGAAANALLVGAGTGTYTGTEGTCAGAPFDVVATYHPDGTAVLASTFAGCANAGLTLLGPRVALDSSSQPPLRVVFHCHGSEAAGLACASAAPPITATLGPSGGPGSQVAFHVAGSFRFEGTVTAV